MAGQKQVETELLSVFESNVDPQKGNFNRIEAICGGYPSYDACSKGAKLALLQGLALAAIHRNYKLAEFLIEKMEVPVDVAVEYGNAKDNGFPMQYLGKYEEEDQKLMARLLVDHEGNYKNAAYMAAIANNRSGSQNAVIKAAAREAQQLARQKQSDAQKAAEAAAAAQQPQNPQQRQGGGRPMFQFFGPDSDLKTQLETELNNPQNKAAYEFVVPGGPGESYPKPGQDQTRKNNLDKLRQKVRAAHGYKGGGEKGMSLLVARQGSPVDNLRKDNGGVVHITEKGHVIAGDKFKAKQGNGSKHTIKAEDVKKAQEEVSIHYDAGKIAALMRGRLGAGNAAVKAEDQDGVAKLVTKHIQQIKTNLRANDDEIREVLGLGPNDRINFKKYKEMLEEAASYVIVRGKVTQYFDSYGEVLPEPVERVMYYANYPCLQRRSHRAAYFAPGGVLDESKKDELKGLFRDVILMQAEVAALNGEMIDIVTPNAFFNSLTDAEKAKAKGWFAEAMVEAAQEIHANKDARFKDLKGIVFHPGAGYEKAGLDNLNFLFIESRGDACAVQKALKKLGIECNCGEGLMGDQLGKAGNAALTDTAANGKEENDTRKCVLWVQMVFGPQFNQKLLSMANFQALPSTVGKQAAAAADNGKLMDAIDRGLEAGPPDWAGIPNGKARPQPGTGGKPQPVAGGDDKKADQDRLLGTASRGDGGEPKDHKASTALETVGAEGRNPIVKFAKAAWKAICDFCSKIANAVKGAFGRG